MATSVATGLIVPATAGVYLPPKPAIVKPENIEFSKNMLLAMPFTLGMLPSKGGVPISYVGFATAATTTVTIPAHQAGDLIIMVGFRTTTGTFSAAPAGWTAYFSDTTTATTFQIRCAYRIATASGTTSGTWTGASQLNCFVYRGATGIGNTATVRRSGTGTTLTYPSLTLLNTSGTSWVVGFNRNSGVARSIPAGRTTRRDGGSSALDLWDTNGGVSSYTPDSTTVSSLNDWLGVIELLE